MALSKKIRFEVFKRDKFTCQYCGQKAPDIILEVDHIEPKSKGGKDQLLNLITSCIDCNRGKRDIRLNDETMINKQREQISLLQERRNQLKMMLDWKKSLVDLENETLESIVTYIESKIHGFKLNEHGKSIVKSLIDKYKFHEILNAVDISARKYIKFNNNDIDKESIEDFLKKIGGILCLQNKNPIDQKLAYIKGICRNRFSYFDPKQASILLSAYVTALEEKKYSEQMIIDDLESDVIPTSKKAKHWTDWKVTIETWIEQINTWK